MKMEVRRDLENSMLLPCVHDPRADMIEIEDDEPEKEFCIGDIVSDGKERYKIIGTVWHDDTHGWLYECEYIGNNDWWYMEIYEDELSAV